MEAFFKLIGIVVVFLVMVFGFSILCAFPTMWLVNDLFTPAIIFSLFGVAKIGFWQALALNVLCGLLFKGSSSSSSKD